MEGGAITARRGVSKTMVKEKEAHAPAGHRRQGSKWQVLSKWSHSV